MLHFIWVLIIGGLIGLVASMIVHRNSTMGWISNIIAGLAGSFIGERLLGSWGPQVADIAIVPAIIGAIVLVLIISACFGIWNKDKTVKE